MGPLAPWALLGEEETQVWLACLEHRGLQDSRSTLINLPFYPIPDCNYIGSLSIYVLRRPLLWSFLGDPSPHLDPSLKDSLSKWLSIPPPLNHTNLPQ